MNNRAHKPVLLREVEKYLAPRESDNYLDLTAGFGGHAKMVAKRLGDHGKITLVERDEQAISHLKSVFSGDKRVRVIHDDFLSASAKMHTTGERYDCILADLGVSSYQIDDPSRGFSYQRKGPLDMRMNVRQQVSASDIVNSYKREELEDILRKYGELTRHQASRTALSIIANRPLTSTSELKAAVNEAIPRSKKLIEAQIFQALRIEVNNELELLKKSLPVWAELLAPGGRLVVVSFHSLEDRIVKQFFVQRSKNRYDADLSLQHKKPIRPSQLEIVHNPRARSAKLRSAVKK